MKGMRPGKGVVAICLLGLLGLWVSQVSTAGDAPRGCFDACSQYWGAGKAGRLRVVSLNMLHGFPDFADLARRLELIAEEIARLEADIVLLQEVPWTLKTGAVAGALAERLGMNYAYLRANGGRYTILFEEGEAILSRYPLEEVRWVTLQPAAGFFENRVALAAQVNTPGGPLWVVSTHLTTRQDAVKAGQSTGLIRFGEALGGLALVGADFNRDPGGLAQEAAPPWDDPLGRGQPGEGRLTCCIDERQDPAETPEKAIDAILVVGGWQALEAAGWRVAAAERVFDRPFETLEGWLWVSDHLGVLVELERNP